MKSARPLESSPCLSTLAVGSPRLAPAWLECIAHMPAHGSLRERRGILDRLPLACGAHHIACTLVSRMSRNERVLTLLHHHQWQALFLCRCWHCSISRSAAEQIYGPAGIDSTFCPGNIRSTDELAGHGDGEKALWYASTGRAEHCASSAKAAVCEARETRRATSYSGRGYYVRDDAYGGVRGSPPLALPRIRNTTNYLLRFLLSASCISFYADLYPLPEDTVPGPTIKTQIMIHI